MTIEFKCFTYLLYGKTPHLFAWPKKETNWININDVTCFYILRLRVCQKALWNYIEHMVYFSGIFFFLCWRYLEVIAFHPTNYMHMEKTLFEKSPWKSASEVIKMVWMSIIRALCNADMVTFSFRYHFSHAIWF